MDDQSREPEVNPASLTDLRGIEVVFDQSGLNRSSRDQPDRTFPCPHPGCDVACKRKYERDRHYQTKHVQSKELFCPIGRCRCSRDADELAEVFSAACFYSWDEPTKIWASLRENMKADVVEHRSLERDPLGEYSRVLLHGFARRDRIIKHIKKAHKDIDTAAAEFSIDRDALVGEPMYAELQEFWYSHVWGSNWRRVHLARLQRTDDSWTEWFGEHQADVATAGFHSYTETDENNYDVLRKRSGYENVLPWEAQATLQKLKLPAIGEGGNITGQPQLDKVNTGAFNVYKDAGANRSTEDKQNSSTRFWPTNPITPEGATTSNSNVTEYDTVSPYPQLLEVMANVPAFSVTPGHSGGSLSTENGVLTPMYHFGNSLPLDNFTTPTAAPAIEATSGAAQDDSLWLGSFGFDGMDPTLPALPWGNSLFSSDGMYAGDFDFSDFNAISQGEPKGTVEHDVDEPEQQIGEYSGLGKRRFSQV